MKSIKTKLTAVFFLILVLSLGTLSFFNYSSAYRALIASTEQALTSLNVASGKEIGLWLEKHKYNVVTIANTPSLASGNQEVILSYLRSEIKREKNYETLFVTDSKGDYYITEGKPGSVGDRDYFKQVMATGEPVVSNPVVSKASGNTVVVVAAPLKKDNKVIGMLGATIVLDELIQKVGTIKVGKTGYAFMIQEDGLIIAHAANKELVMNLNLLNDGTLHQNLVQAARQMVKGESGITRYVFQGVDKYTSFAPVTGNKWSLAITAPVAEVASALKSLAVISIILTLVILLVAGGVAFFLSNQIVRPILVLKREIDELADKGGDLTQEIHVSSKDEIGDLAGAINKFLANFRKIMAEVRGSAETTARTAQQLTLNAQQTAAGASQTASTIGEIATTMDQVVANVQEVSKDMEAISIRADEGSKGLGRVTEQMQKNTIATRDVAVVVEELSKKSQEISQIVEMITNIADQTNLLALNAAIEAARAGEQGRGFAVVADEVKKLAEQSVNATKEVISLITAIQAEAKRSVESITASAGEVEAAEKLVREVGSGLGEIIGAVQSSAAQFHDVADAAEQVSSGVENVAAAAEEQTATMEEVSASAESLSRLSDELNALVSRFKV